MSEFFTTPVPNATRVVPPSTPESRIPSRKLPRVYLFGTCVVDLFYPEAGMDAIHLLNAKGFAWTPKGQSCCGQPAYTGLYRPGPTVARSQLALFAADYPVVVLSGSLCRACYANTTPTCSN